MTPPSFHSTPEFAHFKQQMKKLLSVPKERVDELVREAKAASPRLDNPNAPCRKPTKRKRKTAR